MSDTPPLSFEDTFAFRCAPDLGCFGRCCRNKHLPLTPYDVLRLKKALSINSDEFLERYVVYTLDPISGFPVLSLRMEDERDRSCPFLGPQGCRVYQDRPTACRLFPLSRASRPAADGASYNVRFSMVSLPYCLGSSQGLRWSVGSWVENQGLGAYCDSNDRMLSLLFHPRARRGVPLRERQIQRILVACYNLDVFREYLVAEPLFDRLGVPNEARAALLEDDTRLLAFAYAFLEKTLFPRDGSSRHDGC